jgi:hypothetical protein
MTLSPPCYQNTTESYSFQSDAPIIWLVEDEAQWQHAFTLLLGLAFNEPHILVADSAEKTQDWLLKSAKQSFVQWPDLVLMDWQLANGGNGLRLADSWVELGLPAERIIIVSGSDDLPEHPYSAVSKVNAGSLLIPTMLERLQKTN